MLSDGWLIRKKMINQAKSHCLFRSLVRSLLGRTLIQRGGKEKLRSRWLIEKMLTHNKNKGGSLESRGGHESANIPAAAGSNKNDSMNFPPVHCSAVVFIFALIVTLFSFHRDARDSRENRGGNSDRGYPPMPEVGSSFKIYEPDLIYPQFQSSSQSSLIIIMNRESVELQCRVVNHQEPPRHQLQQVSILSIHKSPKEA